MSAFNPHVLTQPHPQRRTYHFRLSRLGPNAFLGPRNHRIFFSFALVALLAAGTAWPQLKPSANVNHDAAISAEFDKRVADYMKLHQKAQSGLTAPKGTESSSKITEYQHELAERILAQRPEAKQGEIFTPEIADLFRRLIANSLNGPDGTKIRKSYQRAEPIHDLRLDVNQAYPDSVPLQSMPPSLLLNLPRLPKELEYRFLSRELILRDVAANLIVDLIPDVTTPDKQ